MRRYKNDSKTGSYRFKVFFCLVSSVIIIFVLVLFSNRVYNYYQVYHPKNSAGMKMSFLNKTVIDNSFNHGLVRVDNKYYFKGQVNNNYVRYNNILWRIVSIDEIGTLTIIVDDYLNMLPWDNDSVNYTASEIKKYLHNYVYANLNNDLLTKISVCDDKINQLNPFVCQNQDDNQDISLLDINDFLQTIDQKQSFLVKDNEIFWLANRSDDKVWHTNGASVSSSNPNSIYEIKPVVKLKGTVNYYQGDGTIDNPYLTTDEEKIGFGSLVKLGNDLWIIYDTRDDWHLMKTEVIKETYRFDVSKINYNIKSNSSLAEYLNTNYFDRLSYNNLIKKSIYYDGVYDSRLNDILEHQEQVYIGIPNMLDIKFNSTIKDYYLSTGMESLILVYDNPIYATEVTNFKNIRPCITIKNDVLWKYVNGHYELDV